MPSARKPAAPSARAGHAINKAAVAGAVAVIIAVALIFWARDPHVENLSSDGAAIIAFGDSLTAGYGAGEGADYPSRLSESIGRPIVNAGRNGDTTASALARLETDVLVHDPRVVIVGLGGNDFLRGEPIATTEENLRTIVRRIHTAGAMVVLLGFEFPSISVSYANMYERVAESEECLLIDDVLDGILNDAKLKSDQIHPNAAGYDLMAQRVAEPVTELLERADDAR